MVWCRCWQFPRTSQFHRKTARIPGHWHLILHCSLALVLEKLAGILKREFIVFCLRIIKKTRVNSNSNTDLCWSHSSVSRHSREFFQVCDSRIFYWNFVHSRFTYLSASVYMSLTTLLWLLNGDIFSLPLVVALVSLASTLKVSVRYYSCVLFQCHMAFFVDIMVAPVPAFFRSYCLHALVSTVFARSDWHWTDCQRRARIPEDIRPSRCDKPEVTMVCLPSVVDNAVWPIGTDAGSRVKILGWNHSCWGQIFTGAITSHVVSWPTVICPIHDGNAPVSVSIVVSMARPHNQGSVKVQRFLQAGLMCLDILLSYFPM